MAADNAEGRVDSEAQKLSGEDVQKRTNVQTPQLPNEYISGIPLALICFGLGLSVMCVGFDRTIISSAIPKITQEFNSLDDVAWYGSSYLLSTCCFQLMFGRFYAEYKSNWVFLTALGLFESGSLICGCAPNSVALIVGRAISGVGCAGIMTGVFSILVQIVPLHKRPMYTGIISSGSAIAQIIAPTLGGIFTDRATWRWCFWINLPLGGITAAVIIFLVKLPTPKTRSQSRSFRGLLARVDLAGTAVLIPWIVCLLLALEWGGTTYAWSNWRIILLLCLFGVLLAFWTYIQYAQRDKGTLPLHIIKQRSVACGMVFMLGIAGSLFNIIYYIPIWFQVVKGVTAEQSGINFLAFSGSMVLANISSGALASKIGYYVPQMLGSSIITSVAGGLIYRYSLDTSTGYWVGTIVMFGFGAGMGIQMTIAAVQTVLKGPDIPVGMSLVLLVQTLSGAVFLSVGQNVFQTKLVSELAVAAPEVDPNVVLASGASGVGTTISNIYGAAAVRGVLEAYNTALQQCFLVCIVLSCITLVGAAFMEWKNIKAESHKNEDSKESSEKV
ncbi:major facilitator superfamily-domain-containing protein [Xylariales sp. PMI_506]|nr:major facilitator superfamily-domain-containing protein [Xylariales sp. PMI_506]